MKLLSSNFIAVGLQLDDYTILNDDQEILKIINLNSGEIVKSIEIQQSSIVSLNFNSEKNVLFTGLENEDILIWQF